MLNDEYSSLVNNDESTQVGIDFDGVIHSNNLGYHDGTLYGSPLPGSIESLRKLSQKYTIIIYTCKARKDRPLINGKTGSELVWEWLRKYEIDNIVKLVTSEKPRAAFYIDDKAYRFDNWESVMEKIEKIK